MNSEKKISVKETLTEKAERMTGFDKSFGAARVCGVDEAGRGPLAGPLAVCACVMPYSVPVLGIDDSKKLSETKREELYEKITAVADYCVVLIDEQTIDKINILEATKLGMKRAIEGLKIAPDLALIDAVKGLDISVPYKSIIKCDAESYATAAASIIAKVTRDRLMYKLDEVYPDYGFAQNKGYGTAKHIEALKIKGYCPSHRQSFIKNFNVTAAVANGETEINGYAEKTN